MNTEDYVSYEVAKLLKEKGFHETSNTIGTYNNKGEFYLYRHEKGYDHNRLSTWYSAPTLQMAMKWLREKHILVLPEPKSFTLDGEVATWVYNIWCDDNCEVDADFFDGEPFEKYEDACEAGIKYCLENFI